MRSTLSTSVENSCVSDVITFITANNDDMYANSQNRPEPENRTINVEDLARAMVRAAELVWIAHLKNDMKNVVEELTATGSAAKALGNMASENLATALLGAGVGPATAVPAAVASTVAQLSTDTATIAQITATPLNIQVPNSAPIMTL